MSFRSQYPGAVKTTIPGVFLLPDDRYLVRVTWCPRVDGEDRFFEIIRYIDGSLEDAAVARLSAREELRTREAPAELLAPDGAVLGRVYGGRLIPDRPPTPSIPRPPASLFEAVLEE